jgi:hypothetical protein
MQAQSTPSFRLWVGILQSVAEHVYLRFLNASSCVATCRRGSSFELTQLLCSSTRQNSGRQENEYGPGHVNTIARRARTVCGRP